MGNVDGGVTAGGKATLNYGPAEFAVSVDKTVGGSDGLLGTVGVEFTEPVNEKLMLGAGSSILGASCCQGRERDRFSPELLRDASHRLEPRGRNDRSPKHFLRIQNSVANSPRYSAIRNKGAAALRYK